MARELAIPEGKIDELEIFHRDIENRVIEILRYHKEVSDEPYWLMELRRALERARRTDISEKVDMIFAKCSRYK